MRKYIPEHRAKFAYFMEQRVRLCYKQYLKNGTIDYLNVLSLLMNYSTEEINAMLDRGEITGPRITRSDLAAYAREGIKEKMKDPRYKQAWADARKESLDKMAEFARENAKNPEYCASANRRLNAARKTKIKTDEEFNRYMKKLNEQKLKLARTALQNLLQNDEEFKKAQEQRQKQAISRRKSQINYEMRMRYLRDVIEHNGIDVRTMPAAEFREIVLEDHGYLFQHYPENFTEAFQRDYRRLRKDFSASLAQATSD